MDKPDLRCAHCDQPAPADGPRVLIDGVSSVVCCAGCAAAAQWIGSAGLDDYYRLRSKAAPRPESDAKQEDYAGWLHPDIVADHVRPFVGGLEIRVLTDAMRCAACAWLIGQALQRIAGVIEADANAITGRVRIAWDPTRVALPALLSTLDRLGFPMHLSAGADIEGRRRAQRRRDLMRLGVAGLGAMQAMMLSEAVYLDSSGEMAIATRDFIRWFTFLVSTPVVFYSGWPFLIGAWRELRLREFGMDTLVAVSVLLAYFMSLFETVRGGPYVWFDAAVMFVFLLLTARQAEHWVRRRAVDQLDLLERSRPALAWRVTADGRERVSVRTLQEGDVVQLAPGDVAPADGTLNDPGSFDESLLTGESLPVERKLGDVLLAGSICHGRAVSFRITATGRRTYLATLQQLIDRAQAERPLLAQWADRIARRFVLAMLMLAIGVFAYWWLHDPERAFAITLAVLVIGCPCALSLAIPTALAAAQAQLAARGVLTLRAAALDRLAQVDTIILDKTGTLTCGMPRITATESWGDRCAADVTALAAALQVGTRHPLANAFGIAQPNAVATDVRTVPGAGIEGQIDGRLWRLGRAEFAAGRVDDGAIWLGDGLSSSARFQIEDALKPDAVEAVAALQALGLQVKLLSGDALDPVAAVAKATAINDALARQSPAAKLAFVRERQQQGHRVAMVGDGINDAPVLAGADVSFALAKGAAMAQRSADFVIVAEALNRVPETIVLARRTRRIVAQNLGWALAYNAVAIPFAAMGLVEPWLAALGMALSSLGVSLNALRLRVTPRRMS